MERRLWLVLPEGANANGQARRGVIHAAPPVRSDEPQGTFAPRPPVRELAGRLGRRAEARRPGKSTTDISRAGRAGRVFIDTNRNAQGQHIVAPYSPRARPGAPVSFPVGWDELDKIEPASNGAWLVYGTHILRTEDGKEKSFTVGFVLKKRGNVWAISEVSADVKQ